MLGHLFIFCAFVALMQLVARLSVGNHSRRDRYLLLTLGTLAYILYFAGTAIAPGVFPAPGLLHWHLPALFALGPAIHYFLKFALLPDEDIRPLVILLQWLPALLCLSFVASPYYPQRDLGVAYLLETYTTRPTDTHDLIAISAFAVNTGYYLWNVYETRFLFRLNAPEFSGIFRYVALFQVGSVITPLLAMASLLTHELVLLKISCSLISLTIIGGYIASIRYPHFFLPLQAEAQKQKYQASHLKNVDIRALGAKLDLLMREEQVFLDDRLSVRSLAAMLQITTHQLSEYINVHHGKNFSGLLNDYRVAEARRLLEQNQEMSVIEVAFASGFGTKSNFNSVFARVTGMSPVQFRRQKSGQT
ncbi:MAG: helix-turn-helix domain-containing protein [Spirochaetota bacterium]